MDTTQLNQAISNLTYPRYGDVFNGVKLNTTEEFRTARDFYNVEKSRLEKQWMAWLGDTYASSFSTNLQTLIFQKAWEDGHSSGYHEVENHYIDYAAFADQVIDMH